MLSAYLYHINRNKLQLLKHEEIEKQLPAKLLVHKAAGEDESTLQSGNGYCDAGEFIWVEAVAATSEDYQLLQARFDLPDLLLSNIQKEKERPRLHDYNDYSHLVFHAVLWAEEQQLEGPANFELLKIDCVLGTDYIITFHDRPIRALEELQKRWKEHPQLMKHGISYLLYELMDAVLNDYFPALEALDDRIDRIENRLFESERNSDGKVTAEIFSLKRDLLQIRHVAGPMRDMFNALLHRDAESGRKYFAYFQALYGHSTRIVEMTDTFRDVLGSALDAFLAAESNRMNAVMKTLTSASIILLIPNLIAAIYGMNFDHMPELHTRYGYPVVLGFMLAIMLALYVNFKRKDWL